MIGMTYKYNQNKVDRNRGLARLFPSYGCTDVKDNFKTNRVKTDVPSEQLYNEV